MMSTHLPLVEVIWDDAHADDSETLTLDDVAVRHRPCVWQVVGWLLKDDEMGVSVACERCLDQGDECYRGRTFVPRAMVKSVIPIIKPRKRRVVMAELATVPSPVV